MTQYQATAARSNYGWRQNRTLSQKLDDANKFGNITRGVLAILVVFGFGLLYVAQATKAGAFAGPTSDMEQKVTELRERNQALTIEVAKMQSLDQLEHSAAAGTLATPVSVDFID